MNTIGSRISVNEGSLVSDVNDTRVSGVENETPLKRQNNDQVSISLEAKILDLSPPESKQPSSSGSLQNAVNEIYEYQKTLNGQYNPASKADMESSTDAIHSALKSAHDQIPTYGEDASRISSAKQTQSSVDAYTVVSKIQAENYDRLMSSGENVTQKLNEFKEKISDEMPGSEDSFSLKFIDGVITAVGIGGKLSEGQLGAINDALQGEEGKALMNAIESLHNSYEKLASDQIAILENSFAKDKIPEKINMNDFMKGFDYGKISENNLSHAHRYFQRMIS